MARKRVAGVLGNISRITGTRSGNLREHISISPEHGTGHNNGAKEEKLRRFFLGGGGPSWGSIGVEVEVGKVSP